MLSLIVVSEEQLVRRGIREHEAFLHHEMRDPPGTGRGDVSMDGEWQGHEALKGVGRGDVQSLVVTSNFFFWNLLMYVSFCLDEGGR